MAEQILDLFPVVFRDISRDNNVKITGTFRTSDKSAEGRPCYILIRRPNEVDSDGKNLLTQGFGIAWRKSSAGCPNLFVVDQSIDIPEMVVDGADIAMGEAQRQYLAHAYKEILVDTDYKFELTINNQNAVQLRIWESSASRPIVADLTYGAYRALTSGTYFGIGVLGTEGGEWQFDDLTIYGLGPEYATYIASFETSFIPVTADIMVRGYGVGNNSGAEGYGIELLIFNYTQNKWELIGSNSASEMSSVGDKTITLNDFQFYGENADDYMSPNGAQRIFLMVRSRYPSIINDDVTIQSKVGLDYVEIAGYIASGFHAGGKVDIYVRTTNRTATSQTVLSAPKRIKLVKGQFNLPIARIKRVVLLDASLSEIGELTSSEWTLEVIDQETRFSTEELLVIVIDDAYLYNPIKIEYEYFDSVQDVQNALNEEMTSVTGLAEPGTDFLAKELIPAFIDVNVEYRGPDVEPADVKASIISWINTTLTTSFEKSDLVAYMYQLGADYVNLDEMDVVVSVTKKDGGIDTFTVADAVTLQRIERFIADKVNVTRLAEET